MNAGSSLTHFSAATFAIDEASLWRIALVASIVLVVGSYALGAWILGRLFAKAGIASWKAWVPGYNTWLMLEMGGLPGWVALIAIVPYVGIISVVFYYVAMYRISQNFGKPRWFFLLAIFVPLLWIGWLAFDDSRWKPVHRKGPAFQLKFLDTPKAD